MARFLSWRKLRHQVVVATVAGLFPLTAMAAAPDVKQQLLERVFGAAVRLDPATIAKVKALPRGERLLVDTNGDGEPEECWFIDDAPRHEAKARPLLVRAIDEDGDMGRDKGPDLDSDLYIADWKADGTADTAVDYQDNDRDGDVDEMGIYYFSPREASLGGQPGLRCWWGRDDGDDNQLWYDVNYTYQQRDCQWRTHFSGDETLVAFVLGTGAEQWLPTFENPFVFYDPDNDSCSEVVIRISGTGDRIESLRYSFDADDDAYGRRTHDYEFSITALAPGSSWVAPAGPAGGTRPAAEKGFNYLPEKLELTAEVSTSTSLRGIPTGRFLSREYAQRFCAAAPWARVLLTWDEMNANTEANVAGDPHERWEGLIARGSQDFPQIGGPPCSNLNKRCEILDEPRQALRMYYEPADRRLHLRYARRGWLHVDFDLDGKSDAEYLWLDEDRDGFFDRRQVDLNADGSVEFDWRITPNKQLQKPAELDFKALTATYTQALTEDLADSQHFIEVAKAALGPRPADPVEVFFLTKLEGWMPSAGLGAWMRKSPGGARLYLDLLRDRLLLALKSQLGTTRAWAGIGSRYAAGDLRGAAERILRETRAVVSPQAETALGDFAYRIPLHFDNTGSPQRDDWPVTIRVADLQAIARDFNPRNCAVVAAERWLGWRQVPHQVDVIDESVGAELSFLVDLPADGRAEWFLYYSPTGQTATTFPAATDAAEDWVPPNIGWESRRIAYRTYYGQFDFFGKKLEQLVYGNIGAKSYHSEVEWGIDALNTYATSGCGGLTLYLDHKAYKVQNPVGKGEVKFAKRQLARGPVRAAIETVATNVVPRHPEWSVRMRAIIYAQRQETEIRVAVTGPTEAVTLGTGFTRLPVEHVFSDPQAGCFGIWAAQTPVIGEIGMAVIGAPAAFQGHEQLVNEHAVKWRAADGRLRYWLIADWRQGRQYPIAPTVQNWRAEVKGLGQLLLKDAALRIEHPERVR